MIQPARAPATAASAAGLNRHSRHVAVRGVEGAEPLASPMYAHWVGPLLPTNVFGRSPFVGVSGSLVGVL